MKPDVLDHPAVQLGEWLQKKRRERGIVARVFAGRIDLSPAEYAEVESGIIHWVGEKQEMRMPLLLGLNDEEVTEFNAMVSSARRASQLEFTDVFSENELAPARCCTADGKQIDEDRRKAIIKAVFTPLNRDA